MNLSPNNPIGIFDSGVGGLTVASAIHHLLPGEQIIYYGDTAHLPYGDKSKETIIYYSEKITEFLLEKDCKIIVIACNTASSNAYENIVKLVGSRALVINVIDPVVDYIQHHLSSQNIGVIGTKGTINSKSYQNKINNLNKNITVSSLATPLLVPMIEEGFIFDDISNAIIRNYLSRPELQNIQSLVLGCTHYPIIQNQIKKYYNFKVNVLDSAKIVAGFLRNELNAHQLASTHIQGVNHFLVSDYTDYFNAISNMFFEGEINLEKDNIWN
ncbi:MAG: glutamate racemase [Bacteroidales bacterium]|nr:glutamate racemase [Bacteroidales bacterium]